MRSALPAALTQRLRAFAESGEAKRLYDRFRRTKDGTANIPANPLLYVPSQTAVRWTTIWRQPASKSTQPTAS